MDMIIKINVDNDAFYGGSRATELARILRDLARRIEAHSPVKSDEFTLRDVNGNRVGTAYLEEKV
jgi:hypothetical protein